ncbi:protein CHUP1, chloroplastic-like isoform X2 [Andrographis paniculata]|uniref:protein CHUP1, chloroplastic-like isoform X2 n=1 Tax=Andrographis paniculata TaxID=175694 RepID=UPI0021E79F1D|nr:protein CHUP1, chloroplastic-like isoform X2 [Andrographis paniculata]
MVAGKVNSAATGLQRLSANVKPKSDASTAPPLLKQKGSGAGFTRSGGVYFPRASAEVEVSEIERLGKKIGCLEEENERLRRENELLHTELRRQSHTYEEKIKCMQAEFSDVKRAAAEAAPSPSTAAAPTGKPCSRRHVPMPPPSALLSPFSLSSVSSPPPPRPPAKPAAPPPPPPPVTKGINPSPPAKVSRVPEVVEFYHSVMRRDSHCRKSGGGATAATAKDMIGEIKTRSAHLLAIKTDVETQGDFIKFLIEEVEAAAFTEIGDVVAFVNWLDDELSNLVDERAVLKHFDWPEKKADALREAAFGYGDLKKLEAEISSFLDDPRQPCTHSFKRIKSLFEKLEHSVDNLLRIRESAVEKYRGFQIPVDWMLDTGCISQIKLASMKLAMKYMRRVSAELEIVGDGPEEQELIVQGIKFAFRVHQFARGFDVETMKAFQELRAKAR